jgi:hypothetical protein
VNNDPNRREVLAYVAACCDWTDWPARRAAKIVDEHAAAAREGRRPAKIAAVPTVHRESFSSQAKAEAAVAAVRARAAERGWDLHAWVEVLHSTSKPSPPAWLPGTEEWPQQKRPPGR